MSKHTWSPHVAAALDSLLEGPAGSAVFDFDHTVIWGDIGLTTASYVDRTTGSGIYADYLAIRGAGDHHSACVRLASSMLSGRTADEVRSFARAAWNDALTAGTLEWEPAVVDLIARLHEAGWQVWIVTASPALAVEPLAADLGIPAERVIGMRSAVGADGRMAAEIETPCPHGAGKADALRAAGLQNVRLGAGDSPADAPMMELAELGLAIDRGSDALIHAARAHGWPVQSGWGAPRMPEVA